MENKIPKVGKFKIISNNEYFLQNTNSGKNTHYFEGC